MFKIEDCVLLGQQVRGADLTVVNAIRLVTLGAKALQRALGERVAFSNPGTFHLAYAPIEKSRPQPMDQRDAHAPKLVLGQYQCRDDPQTLDTAAAKEQSRQAEGKQPSVALLDARAVVEQTEH